MTRSDAGAIGLQVLGSAATVAVVMLVTHRFGLEAQGRFSLLKSWMDTAVVVCLLGLPQALLHIAYHGSTPLGGLRVYAERYAAGVLLLALLAAALAAFGPVPWLGWSLLAVPGLVLHGLLRALVLKAAGPPGYALATVMPATALLLVVGALALTGWSALGPGLVLSSTMAAVAMCWLLARAGVAREPEVGLRIPRDIHGHAFVQNLAAAAQAAALLGLLSLLGAPAAVVGEASVSLLVMQLFGVAAAYLAPLIYDRAARGAEERRGPDWPVRGGLLLVFAAAILLLPWALTLAVPQASAKLQQACQIMTVAGLLLLANRVVATRLQAQGAFADLTVLAILRLAASAAVLAGGGAAATAKTFAVAVLAGEVLASVGTVWALWRRGQQS